jgi:hypothetical protein
VALPRFCICDAFLSLWLVSVLRTLKKTVPLCGLFFSPTANGLWPKDAFGDAPAAHSLRRERRPAEMRLRHRAKDERGLQGRDVCGVLNFGW